MKDFGDHDYDFTTEYKHFDPIKWDPILVERLSRSIRASELWLDFFQSQNYVSGTSGFKIGFDGTLEMNQGAIFASDLYSANWVSGGGAAPADLSTVDGTATTGYYIDYSAGAAQFMGDLYLGADLTMITGGKIRTAASGERIEIATWSAGTNNVLFIHGDGDFSSISGALGLMSFVASGTTPATYVLAEAGVAGAGHTFTHNHATEEVMDVQQQGAGAIALFGNPTTKVTIDNVGNIISDGHYEFNTENSAIRGANGTDVLRINNDGVAWPAAGTETPDKQRAIPSNYAITAAATWETVTGSQMTLFTHSGTNRTIEIDANAMLNATAGTTRRTVTARLRASWDNGSSWTNGTARQTDIAASGGAGNRQPEMVVGFMAQGTATDNVLLDLQVYVTAGTDASFNQIEMFSRIQQTF